MAVSSFAESLLAGLPQDMKRVLTELMRYVVPNGRFGPVTHQAKSESFNAHYLVSTTASTASDEFSVLHGKAIAPYLAVPVLPVDSSGFSFVPLYCPRPADDQRVYLQSSVVSVQIALLVE